MTICYFIATGNCLYVARRIGGTLLSIPQLMKQREIDLSDDAVGVVAPVYAGEMPMMVRDFLKKAKITTDYFFFIYTYGMGFGQAFAHVQQACVEKGLKLSYINAVQTVDNYLPGFEMKNQIDTLPQKDVEGQIAKILGDLAARRETKIKLTAADQLQKAMFERMLAKRILRKDTAQRYTVSDACVHCGICEKVCPADNITVTKDAVVFSDRCEVCYACLHNCPSNAIHMKQEQSALRYRNAQVTLRDIIQANE